MKARFVNEDNNFTRGQSPGKAMGIGFEAKIQKMIDESINSGTWTGSHFDFKIHSPERIELFYKREEDFAKEEKVFRYIVKYVEEDAFFVEDHVSKPVEWQSATYHYWRIMRRAWNRASSPDRLGPWEEFRFEISKGSNSIKNPVRNNSEEEVKAIIDALNATVGKVEMLVFVEAIPLKSTKENES